MPKIESAKDLPEYGCIMLGVDIDMSSYHDIIDLEDIYDDGSGSGCTGLAQYSHVTLLYGLCEDIPADVVSDVLSEFQFNTILLPKLSLFETPEYDVLVFEAKSDVLFDVNKALEDALPYYSKYNEYKPHVTVAYLTKGSGAKYLAIFDGLSDMCQPIAVKYSTINDVDEYIVVAISEPLDEEIIYSLYSGMTVAPQQSTNWNQITSTLDGKQDYYNNGASDELDIFQSQLRKHGNNPTLAYDGTMPLNQTNDKYNKKVMEDSSVIESVVTTSSNISNPVPAVLSNDKVHKAEQKHRIQTQLKNFNCNKVVIEDVLIEGVSNYTVSIKNDTNQYAIMVNYLDKECVVTAENVNSSEDDKLDYIANLLFDCFAGIVDPEDLKLIPDVAGFINEKIHQVIQDGLIKTKTESNHMVNRKKTKSMVEADNATEQKNNLLSNPDVVAIIEEIYAHRSDFGEKYEYLTPDEVADIAQSVGVNNPSYNIVTVISTNIEDLIDDLGLDAVPTLIVNDVQPAILDDDVEIVNEPTESEVSLTNKGVEIKQESMQGRTKRRVVEAKAADMIFSVGVKYYADGDGYLEDTLRRGTYESTREAMQWLEDEANAEDITITSVYVFIDGEKVKVDLNDNFTNTKLMKYLLSGSDEDFMVRYNNWIKQGKPNIYTYTESQVVNEGRYIDNLTLSDHEMNTLYKKFMDSEEGIYEIAQKVFSMIHPRKDYKDNSEYAEVRYDTLEQYWKYLEKLEDDLKKNRTVEAKEKNKTVEGWAKELGKPYGEIHKYWLKAEKDADKKLPKAQYWAEVNSIAQRMIGAKYGEFKKHPVKESMFSVVKQNGKLKIITESLEDLEFEVKLSVKGGVDLFADLLCLAGIADDVCTVDYVDNALAIACDNDVYMYSDVFGDCVIDDLLAGEAVFDYVCSEQFTPNDSQMGFVVGESFDSVAKEIAHKEHIPEKNAAAILANSTRNASKAAHKANPKLNRVKG